MAAGLDDLVIRDDDKTTIRKHVIQDPSNKWVKTILCGQCAANNNLNSTFCHYCSRRLDRARARAHKHIQRGVAITKLRRKDVDGLYYHFAFQNFRIRDMTTHPDDRREFMTNLGLEDDPRLVRIFNEFDRKKDEAMEFVEYIRGVVSLCDKNSAPIERARFLFQTYDMNNRAALTSDEVIDVLTIHTDFKALKGADDAKIAAMAGESKAPKPRSKDEIKTFFYTWLKRVSGSVKTRTAGTYRFEEWWQLLHADCRGQAMYAWVKVHLPSLIAQLRKADQAEEALEMEDGDAEDVFYATGVPRELM